MNYELVTVIRPEQEAWVLSKKRMYKSKGKVLSILPSQFFFFFLQDEKVTGVNVFDKLTKRKYDLNKSMYFNEAPVPSYSEIFMNADFSISIINEGEEIGSVELFPQTRRLVKNIHYFSETKKDFTQEYTIDGELFSEIFYFNNKPQEIHFYNKNRVAVISYFFYDGKLEFISLNNAKTGAMIQGYTSFEEFISDCVAKMLTVRDRVTISFMGIEMVALSKSSSYNILELTESPLDDNGEIKGNLLQILKNNISYIHEVKMPLEYKQLLMKKNVPVSKITVSRKE
ncbi:hypothetical protein [Lactococcus garvieae]